MFYIVFKHKFVSSKYVSINVTLMPVSDQATEQSWLEKAHTKESSKTWVVWTTR